MLAERLNFVRKARGYTAQKMADSLDVSIRTYRYYESGHRSPPFDTLIAIADLLDVSIDYLLSREAFLESHGVLFDGFQINPLKRPIS